MPPRRIQSETEGEEGIEEVDDVDDSDFAELDEIEEDVKLQRRSAVVKPASTRSTRASSARSVRASSAAGPSTTPAAKGNSRVAVEIPYMPFSNLKRYSYALGLKTPTTVTRSRTLAAQDGWKEKTPAHPAARKGKGRSTRSSAKNSTRSTPRGFGGYGDDDEDFSTEPSETDYDSDDSLLTRRVRPRVFEPRRTRAQRKEHGTPPSEQPRYTRQQASTQQAQWQTQPNSRQGSEYEPQSEGESEIDDVDMNELDSEPESRRAYSDDDDDVLMRHRPFCERCRLGPADELLAKALKSKKRGRKRKYDILDEPVDPVEHAESLEGWIECVRCCVASHWKCLSPAQQKKVLAEIAARSPDEAGRRSIGIDEVAKFTCSRCEAYPVCFVCEKSHIKVSRPGTPEPEDGDGAQEKVKSASQPGAQDEPIDVDDDEGGLIKSASAPLLFRCDRCKQAVHYEHLRDPFPAGTRYTTSEIGAHYQKPDADGMNAWYAQCCRDLKWLVDRVIAWRPVPANAEEPPRKPGELPNYRDRLPREYLVKWKDRSFRHLSWVPHAWLLAINGAKLRNFIVKGPQLDLVTNETLAAKGDEMSAPTIRDVMADEPQQRHPRELDALEEKWRGHGPPPDVDAESSIPVDWSTVDRILEVHLLPPKGSRKAKRRIEDSDEEEDPAEVLRDGIAPPTSLAMPIQNWELRAERQLTADDIDEVAPLVTWALIKWQNLQYDEACYDTPPPKDSPLYPAYRKALQRYLAGRQVQIPVLSDAAARRRDQEAALQKDPPEGQPNCVTGGNLMPFQIEGLQWLNYKYYHRQSCILADDMGLGKPIQVASFLGYLHSQEIFPSLVVVPNSTITNWVREIEKWVPDVRVVPYYGEALSRKLIATHELYHPGKVGKADGLKAHVVLTTYESFINNHTMFMNVPRWECVIVDEGQRVKSDSSLIFNRLKQLHSIFRVLLTGTPLNNNLRELFNLLNFLDPEKFSALKELEARFENLNEGLLTELHELISPYILRRIKRDVLKLPPKVEIIVPIAMTLVQKQVTREILHRNVETIEGIVKKRKKKATAKGEDIEVVDITDEMPAPNGEPAETREKMATPEAGPSATAGADSALAAASGAEPAAEGADVTEAATETMDVGDVDSGPVLDEDSQPASTPASQPNDDSAEKDSEYNQPQKLRGGFSVKGAAAAAARKRWDKHRRDKELAAMGRAAPPTTVDSPREDVSDSDEGFALEPESMSPESSSSADAAPRGHGGFCKPGAAAAAPNARWAKVRQQRAEQAAAGHSQAPCLLSDDEPSSEEETPSYPPPPPALADPLLLLLPLTLSPSRSAGAGSMWKEQRPGRRTSAGRRCGKREQ